MQCGWNCSTWFGQRIAAQKYNRENQAQSAHFFCSIRSYFRSISTFCSSDPLKRGCCIDYRIPGEICDLPNPLPRTPSYCLPYGREAFATHFQFTYHLCPPLQYPNHLSDPLGLPYPLPTVPQLLQFLLIRSHRSSVFDEHKLISQHASLVLLRW